MNDAAARSAHAFTSILLSGQGMGAAVEAQDVPACFHDLHLDQIVASVTAGKEAYNLAPFFYAKVQSLDDVAYRQEVMRDLERPALMEAMTAFASGMKAMREQLAQMAKLHYRYEKERWLLGAVSLYGASVERLMQALERNEPASRGLRAWATYLMHYAQSEAFGERIRQSCALLDELSAIRYSVYLKGRNVTVRPYEGEIDASTSIEETFAKFRHGAAKSYLAHFSRWPGLDHIDAQVLERVALLHPDTFAKLEVYGQENAQFLDAVVERFEREIQFYVAYLSYIGRFRARGLSFCYPQLSDVDKGVSATASFDLALADRLVGGNIPVVRNDFYLEGSERLLVVSGPNQGGKTTFARTFGQLHWLASLGCAVPGKDAKLFFFDHLLTHFEREEDIATLRGKLKDDLVRIHDILGQATHQSIVIINEIFASTTLDDAMYLGKKVMQCLSHLDVIGVCVTFLVELASYNEVTVSMTSQLDPNDPARRTFKVERRAADGLAYALAIAEKYHVTYDWLLRRIGA